MAVPVARVLPLMFGSGLCALLYQTAWLRELRLTFGFSTAATAAVLAIFMGGLGAGGALFGRRADAHPRPLLLYARLELLTALTAALTPLWALLARAAYTALGGTAALGLFGGTVLRLLLSALVLLAPALLMGGTLPAAARAVSTAGDERRRDLALLYGVNTLGAVSGALAATFLLLEIFGVRRTLWGACLLNLLVAVVAGMVGREAPGPAPSDAEEEAPAEGARAPAWFVLAAAGLSGFVFLLMELVWYRMLSPILGGSTFTFGLILAVALLGIGLGSVAYALRRAAAPATLLGFGLCCALQALLLALPLWAGDSVAVLALLLRPVSALGFSGHLFGWAVITALLVLPAALLAGLQFPLLINLLGRGGRAVGRQVGLAYGCNTAGAIAGSLAGGFGLLPLLSAPGAWRLCVALLLALAVVAAAVVAPWARERRPGLSLGTLLLTLLTLPLLASPGPTAAWRHSGIGAGRASLPQSPSDIRAFIEQHQRRLLWEHEGVEGSVAMVHGGGYAFVLNGKVDGHCYYDGPTQVMGGLLGAFLHPSPRRALVIGLGSGSTAGWLGAVPQLERVDVLEIEPALLRVAATCAAVNREVLGNPRVRITIGDAREGLLTSKERYDLIFSEPSNPYRAGIASLYTSEFYRAARRRLSPGGMFIQWLQTYEVDAQTVRGVYSTLAAEFPHVETWFTRRGDVLLVCAEQAPPLELARLRARLQEAPFAEAAQQVLRVNDVEGLLAHYLAADGLAREVARAPGAERNSDDRTLAEFGFARSVGARQLFDLDQLRQRAVATGQDLPPQLPGLDPRRLQRARLSALSYVGVDPRRLLRPGDGPAEQRRAAALEAYAAGQVAAALQGYQQAVGVLPLEITDPVEQMLVAEGLALIGADEAAGFIDRLGRWQPTEAAALRARWSLSRGNVADAARWLREALLLYRRDAFANAALMERALALTLEIAQRDRGAGEMLLQVVQQPFVLHMNDEQRALTALELAFRVDFGRLCLEPVLALGAHPVWLDEVLRRRLSCLEQRRHPAAARAREDYAEFLLSEPMPFDEGLPPVLPR